MSKKIFLLLSILYFLSRFYNLTILPSFSDETSYIYPAKLISGNFWQYWDISMFNLVNKPPLFFWLNALSLKFISHWLFAGRMISVFTGFLTLTGIYLTAKKLFNKKAAMLSSVFYIFSPFALFYDRMALMDSLVTAGFIWSFYFLLKKNFLFLAFIVLLTLLSKQSAKFLFVLIPLSYFFYKSYNFLIPLIFAFGFYNMLRISPGFAILNSFDKTYFLFPINNFNIYTTTVYHNLLATVSWLKSYLTFPFFALFISFTLYFPFMLFQCFKTLKLEERKVVLLFLWAELPIIIQIFVAKIYFPRYLLICFPFIIILISYFVLKILNSNLSFFIFSFSFLVFLLPSLIFDYYILTDPVKAPFHYNEKWQYVSNWPAGYGVVEAINFFQKLPAATSGQRPATIFVEGDNGHLYSTFKLYFEDSPNFDIIPVKRPMKPPKDQNMIKSFLKPGEETEVVIYGNLNHYSVLQRGK